jgi:hypothetical protein
LSTIEKPPTGVGCRHGVSRLGTPGLRESVWRMTIRNPQLDYKVRRSHMRRDRPLGLRASLIIGAVQKPVEHHTDGSMIWPEQRPTRIANEPGAG